MLESTKPNSQHGVRFPDRGRTAKPLGSINAGKQETKFPTRCSVSDRGRTAERERERERETERDNAKAREGERQSDRQTETDRKRDRPTDREADRQAHIER